MNLFVGMGRLTRDPEIRQTQSGISVASFTLAIDRKFKNKAGEKECDFINIVAWRGTAEFVGKYCNKGTKLVVQGNVQTRTYDDKDGKKVYVTEIVADSVEFAESKKSKQDTQNNQDTQQEEIDEQDDTSLPFDL